MQVSLSRLPFVFSFPVSFSSELEPKSHRCILRIVQTIWVYNWVSMPAQTIQLITGKVCAFGFLGLKSCVFNYSMQICDHLTPNPFGFTKICAYCLVPSLGITKKVSVSVVGFIWPHCKFCVVVSWTTLLYGGSLSHPKIVLHASENHVVLTQSHSKHKEIYYYNPKSESGQSTPPTWPHQVHVLCMLCKNIKSFLSSVIELER